MLAPKHKVGKLAFRLIGVFIGAFVIFLLVVPLLGPFWHLVYGNAISYGGWRVPVPGGFYVRNSQEGPTMWKQNLGIPLFRASYGHVSLFRHTQPFVFDRDYSRFEEGVVRDSNQHGYQLRTKRTIPVDKGSAYCLEFTRSSSEPGSLVRCAVEGSPLVAFYEGDPRYVPAVFVVLQGMSLESTKVGRL